jgi:chromosome segregation protein
MAQLPGKQHHPPALQRRGAHRHRPVFSLLQLNRRCSACSTRWTPLETATPSVSEMVKRMSAQTQFLFITHNKITMEMAGQLVGVTMQEQGVSRVVEVDIEEALRMSDEAVPA